MLTQGLVTQQGWEEKNCKQKTQFLLLQLGKEDANNRQLSDCQGCLF